MKLLYALFIFSYKTRNYVFVRTGESFHTNLECLDSTKGKSECILIHSYNSELEFIVTWSYD